MQLFWLLQGCRVRMAIAECICKLRKSRDAMMVLLDVCRYCLQPGVFDACIHLAPVPAAGAPIAVIRVPAAAGALLLPTADGECLSHQTLPAHRDAIAGAKLLLLQRLPCNCCLNVLIGMPSPQMCGSTRAGPSLRLCTSTLSTTQP